MPILWLAALSRLGATSDTIFDLRRKIKDNIAAAADWDPGSPVLAKYNPSVQGNVRVAWTATIPFKDIPATDVLVYLVDETDSRLKSAAPQDAKGFTENSWSEVFIDRINKEFALNLFSPTLAKIDRAAALLGAAALHEAMHNKIDQAKPAGFDLHRSGGFGVASKDINNAVTTKNLMSGNPEFSINITAENRRLLRQYLGSKAPPQANRQDFGTERFMFR